MKIFNVERDKLRYFFANKNLLILNLMPATSSKEGQQKTGKAMEHSKNPIWNMNR